MAKFYPELHEIDNLSEPVTAGERAMLEALAEVLDDSYEVFFQTWIYNQHMDIVILRRGYGVHIIEVKDWQLDRYHVDSEHRWCVETPSGEVVLLRESPLQQLDRYHNLFVNRFSPSLVSLSIFGAGAPTYGCVRTSLYLHNASQQEVDRFIAANNLSSATRNIPFWGAEVTSRPDVLRQRLRKFYTFGTRQSSFFSDAIYTELHRLCQLTAPTRDQLVRHNFRLDRVQQRHYDAFRTRLEAGGGLSMKIRGASGSGKTRLLAEFAALALQHHQATDLLIITFNITLIHQIHDMISLSPHRPRMKDITIQNYHAFCAQYHRLHGGKNKSFNLVISSPREEDKYKTILVDETQDFRDEWVDSLHSLVAERGNIVFFCDEHQDIYGQSRVEQGAVYTGISGAWRVLNSNHRIQNKLATIANNFQKKFLTRYEFAPIEPLEMDMFDNSECSYYYLDGELKDLLPRIHEIYRKYVSAEHIHDNDVAFLGSFVEDLQMVECYLRRRQGLGTNSTFVTFEEEKAFEKRREEIKQKYQPGTKDYNDAIRELDDDHYMLQRSRKCAFWANHGTIKVSTIHSFKGWETSAVILLVTRADGEAIFTAPPVNPLAKLVQPATSTGDEPTPRNIAELLYTGMTRAREQLIIINIGSAPLDKYFRQAEGINFGKLEDF